MGVNRAATIFPFLAEMEFSIFFLTLVCQNFLSQNFVQNDKFNDNNASYEMGTLDKLDLEIQEIFQRFFEGSWLLSK